MAPIPGQIWAFELMRAIEDNTMSLFRVFMEMQTRTISASQDISASKLLVCV